MRGGLDDLLIGVGAWGAGAIVYFVMRLLKLKPTMDVDEMAGLAVGCIIGGFIIYALFAIAIHVIFGIRLWPFSFGQNSN